MTLTKNSILENRYRIEKKLGEGGFGAVYQALDTRLNVRCAVKESLRTTEEATRQFKREAEMLAKLRHDNLPRVTDYFDTADGLYLVMDFIEGDDLGSLLEKNGKPFPVDQALAWINQICDALIYIHGQNPPIIHRDIKPANIRITPQGKAILVDFGLAKIFEANTKTSTGARGLTPHFAAPEQYGMGGTDAQSDIYSLGVTLYCLLTLRVPPDSIEIMVGNADPPLPAKQYNKNIPDSVSEAIQRSTQIRRTERCKSATDFKTALLSATQSKVSVINITSNKFSPSENANDWKNKGDSFYKLKQYEEAIRCYDKALEIDSRNADIWNVKGCNLGNLGRHEESIRCFDKALEIRPRFADAWYNKGYSLINLTQYEESISCFDKALEIDPYRVNAWHNKGSCLTELGQHEESIRCYDKALEIDPRNVVVWRIKGNNLARFGRYEESVYCYDRALEIDPHDVGAWVNKGSSFGKLGRYEESVRCFDKALEIDSHDVLVWYNKGNSLNKLKQHEESVRAYKHFISLAPAQYEKQVEIARQRIKEMEGK